MLVLQTKGNTLAIIVCLFFSRIPQNNVFEDFLKNVINEKGSTF